MADVSEACPFDAAELIDIIVESLEAPSPAAGMLHLAHSLAAVIRHTRERVAAEAGDDDPFPLLSPVERAVVLRHPAAPDTRIDGLAEAEELRRYLRGSS